MATAAGGRGCYNSRVGSKKGDAEPSGAVAALSPEEQDAVAAAQLAAALRTGWSPQSLAAPSIALFQGEQLFSSAPVYLQQYLGAHVEYPVGGFVAFGGPFSSLPALGHPRRSTHTNGPKRRRERRRSGASWTKACYI